MAQKKDAELEELGTNVQAAMDSKDFNQNKNTIHFGCTFYFYTQGLQN